MERQCGGKCYRDPNTTMLWCEVLSSQRAAQFQPLEFWLNSLTSYKVAPEDYVDIVQNNEGAAVAVFRVLLPDSLQYVGLGLPFFRSVYVVLNRENDTVGIGR